MINGSPSSGEEVFWNHTEKLKTYVLHREKAWFVVVRGAKESVYEDLEKDYFSNNEKGFIKWAILNRI